MTWHDDTRSTLTCRDIGATCASSIARTPAAVEWASSNGTSERTSTYVKLTRLVAMTWHDTSGAGVVLRTMKEGTAVYGEAHAAPIVAEALERGHGELDERAPLRRHVPLRREVEAHLAVRR